MANIDLTVDENGKIKTKEYNTPKKNLGIDKNGNVKKGSVIVKVAKDPKEAADEFMKRKINENRISVFDADLSIENAGVRLDEMRTLLLEIDQKIYDLSTDKDLFTYVANLQQLNHFMAISLDQITLAEQELTSATDTIQAYDSIGALSSDDTEELAKAMKVDPSKVMSIVLEVTARTMRNAV